MRRARIRAVATIPVRRKTAHHGTGTEESTCFDSEDKQKIINKVSTVSQRENNQKLKYDRVIDTDQKGKESQKIFDDEGIFDNTFANKVDADRVNTLSDVIKKLSNDITHRNVESIDNANTTENVSSTKVGQIRPCFTRPIPRLDSNGRIRRNSIQGSGTNASESEDDAKKDISNQIISTRIRNNSMCSVQSNKEITNNVNSSYAKFKPGNKKRISISESARKLAEARREFLLKHENKPPDRTTLTMYDLIYYNPITNPMTKSSKKITLTRQIYPSESVRQGEDAQNDAIPLPVPQVKVGPDGQLIVDEQSLVIEQTNAKKHKEILAKEAIVDDDSTSGGFYKKRHKSKDWPKWETLKFYQALSMVGPDFLLMQSLFPNRSRQEIKIKYKKEERINRKLIEKALVNHRDFDIETLKEELAVLDQTEQEESLSEKAQKKVEQKDGKGKKSQRRFTTLTTVEVSSTMEDDRQKKDSILNKAKTRNGNNQFQKRTKKRNKKESIDLDSDEVGSDTEIYHARPTRSGRLPKVRKLQGPEVNLLDKRAGNKVVTEKLWKLLVEENSLGFNCKGLVSSDVHVDTTSSENRNVVPDISKAKPGSLVILSKELPEEPGKTVLQVYMVSANANNSEGQIKCSMMQVDLPLVR